MALVLESKTRKSVDFSEGLVKETKPFKKLAIESMKPDGMKKLPGNMTIGLKSAAKPKLKRGPGRPRKQA